jgi:hypothetical protein
MDMDDSEDLLPEENNVNWNEAPATLPQEVLGGGGVSRQNRELKWITPVQADSREDEATELRKGGARRDKKFRLEVTQAQKDTIADEASRSLLAQGEGAIKQYSDTIDVAAQAQKDNEAVQNVRDKLKDMTTDETDPLSSEIRAIVGSVTMNGIYAKLTTEGTHMQTGELPILQPRYAGTRVDYSAHSNYPDLQTTMKSHKEDYEFLDKLLPKDVNHLLTVQGAPGRDKLVTYWARIDNRDRVGRKANFVAVGWYMPEASQERLFKIIEGDEANDIPPNPDAAEEFFQQGAKGLERPEGTGIEHSGVGRRKSKGIVILPLNTINKLRIKNTTIAAQKLTYQHGPYGVAE